MSIIFFSFFFLFEQRGNINNNNNERSERRFMLHCAINMYRVLCEKSEKTTRNLWICSALHAHRVRLSGSMLMTRADDPQRALFYDGARFNK